MLSLQKQYIKDFQKTICHKCMHKDKNVKCAQLDIYQVPPYFVQMYWYCKNFKNKINKDVI